jgi:hypothetical protein
MLTGRARRSLPQELQIGGTGPNSAIAKRM